MSLEVGQNLTEILGNSGSYVGNPNTGMAQSVLASLPASFAPETALGMNGEFNKSALGRAVAAAPQPTAPAPALSANLAL